MNYYSRGNNNYRGERHYTRYGIENNNGNYGSNCPPSSRPYTVVAGDTLYSIALRYNTTVNKILEYNPQITDPNMIYVGQVICITCYGMIYTVVHGDTLYSIAMKYNLPVDEILAANPEITNPNLIYPGQQICLPYELTCPNGLTSYVVKTADNLLNILTNTGVSLNTLKGSNPSFDENNIVPGTQLCVLPTPCAPPCESDKQVIIPDGVVGIVAVAEYYTVSANDLLKYNPNYPTCYYIPGHPICLPPAVPV